MTKTSSDRLVFVAAAGASIVIYSFWNYHKQRRKYRLPPELVKSPYHKQLQVGLDLALQAGRNLIAYCQERGTYAESRHELDIVNKGQPGDFCTKVDIENEHLVTKGLQKHFPSHRIIGEESTGTGSIPPLTNDPTWIIDPIDGTTNFAHGLPLTCVSIGWCENGGPVLGIVYAPLTDEVYLAALGYGSYRNGIRLAPRSSETTLRDAVVGMEFGYARAPEAVDRMVSAVRKVLLHGCRTCRQLGSGVLDMCYVASGRLDCVYAGVANEGWKPWDYCAGWVVCHETGCAVQSIGQTTDDEDFNIYSNSIICATSLGLLKELRKVITA